MVCKNCGKEIDDKAIYCVHCGVAAKTKKPIYKKWWFWTVFVIVVFVVALFFCNSPNIEYEKVDINTMLVTAEENEIKAETLYDAKHIEITGRIAYISSRSIWLEPEKKNVDIISKVTCDIKDKEHKEFLSNKKEGDIVSVKGKIRCRGGFYNLKIKEIE